MRARTATTIALACVLAGALPALAQAGDSATLTRVSAHIDEARFDSARATLARWQTARGAAAPPSERAAADALAARLERDGSAARDAWLSLALTYPFSADAGLALLRVGQAAVLQGDTSTALVYLTRLVDDFAGSGHTAEAHLWISRAHSLARRSSLACTAARTGLATSTSAEVAGLLRIQEERACAAGAPDVGPPVAATPPARPPAAAVTPPAAAVTSPASVAGGRFAVQSGAFRARAGADALIARLRRAGLQPRLVRVPGSELMRVRVGAFAAPSEAATLRDRLRAEGFDAVVVDDAARESAVP